MKAAAALVSLGLIAVAQDSVRPAFEVASVRPGTSLSLSPRRSGERVTWGGAPLGSLIQYAYSVGYYQISGAVPPAGQTYDIQATIPPGATEEQVKQMFQSLLENRFAMKVHRETKELSVLELIPDPKGHRMKPTQEDTQIAVDGKPLRDGLSALLAGREGRHVAGKAATMEQLVNVLTDATGQPVVDHTGLTGLFDFDVLHAPEDAPFGSALPIRPALQETLGLRLRGTRAPVLMLVIESIGQPGEN
jgi:uncharacterized protein (TIGR03435 family)